MKLADMTVAEAAAAGAKTLVVRAANRGGLISDAWIEVLVAAMEAGMDVAAGMHTLLRDQPALVEAAEPRCRKPSRRDSRSEESQPPRMRRRECSAAASVA